jgi:(2Fe-2S) ferredoxin
MDRGAADVFNALREEQGARLLTNVKVVASGCVEGCLAGPTLYVAPDDVWYGGVTEADVPQIVEQHLVGNEPVEFLRIGPEDFNA